MFSFSARVSRIERMHHSDHFAYRIIALQKAYRFAFIFFRLLDYHGGSLRHSQSDDLKIRIEVFNKRTMLKHDFNVNCNSWPMTRIHL